MRYALLLLVALAPACQTAVDCTTEARSSVSLHLEDEAGQAIAGATVTYTVDGGAEEPCEAMIAGDYVCGWEVEGRFAITSTALGFTPDTFTVDVGADACHVITEAVTRTLTPAVCTDQEVPGVLVNVTDTQGTEITAATVMWAIPNAEMAQQPCHAAGGNTWTCAEEHPGEVEITITEAGPYEAYVAVVTVPHDGCHPITQTLDAVLTFLPD